MLLPALPVAAVEVEPAGGGTLPPVIITEVQTGNAARADEFIELHNTTSEPLDLTGWQLRYITSSATSTKNVGDPSSVINLVPPVVDGQTILIPAGGYYLLYSGVVTLPAGAIGQHYEGLLPATGGSLVLVGQDNQTCEFVAEDAIAWGNTTHLFGEGEALPAGSASANDRLFQRYIDASGIYLDTGVNAQDFAVAAAATAAPSPAAANTQLLPATPLPGSGVVSQLFTARFVIPDCTLPPEEEPPVDPPTVPPEDSPPSVTDPSEPEPDAAPQPSIPAGNIGLKPPMLSELLPNPASPQTDQDDEFIELYNPNDSNFDLSGYVLEVGLKTKKRFVIPDGIKLTPRSFLAFFSADTNLALTNSGSQVVLLDPLGSTLAISEVYATAKDGQSWILANGKWQWTAKPTPNALNIVSAPAVKSSQTKKSKTAASTKTSGSSGQQKASSQEEDVQQAEAVASTSSTPLHPGVLAAIAFSAILYGAYEYRHDVANKVYQLRSYREARRASRRGP